jgi:hypothetical protein
MKMSKAEKLAQVKARQAGYRFGWINRIPKLDILGHENVIHHRTGMAASLYFKVVGRVDRDAKRPSVTDISQYLNMTPPTFNRALRLRAELLLCKSMKRTEHSQLHADERSKHVR